MIHTKRAFRGLSGTYAIANERSTPRNIECLVEFPENTHHVFSIDKGSKGQALLDMVFAHLNLIQDDFFSLKIARKVPDATQNQNQSTCSNDNSSFSPKRSINNDNDLNYTDNNSPTHSHSSSNQLSFDNQLNDNNQEQTNGQESTINNDKRIAILNNNNALIENKSNFIRQEENSLIKHELPRTSNDHSSWLDPNKGIVKQYKSGPPYNFVFCVRFYVSDVNKVTDNVTKHLLYLQLKNDIYRGVLPVSLNSAIILASLILQVEFGDYSEELFRDNYLSNYKLLPIHDDEVDKKIIDLHRQHVSMSANEARNRFLEHASKKIDCYGVEFFNAKDINKILIQLGVSSSGIVVFKDLKKINDFPWGRINKIMFKRKIFSIQLHKEYNEIEYNLLTNFSCKSFWQECVAQHSFFRLQQPKNAPKKFFSFLSFGSKFQYNGKTEYQTIGESSNRPQSHFSRSPSKQYARRTIPVGWTAWNHGKSSVRQPNGQSSISLEDKNLSDGVGLEDIYINQFGSQKQKVQKPMLFIDEFVNNKNDNSQMDASTSVKADNLESVDGEYEKQDVRKRKFGRGESGRISTSLKNVLFSKKTKASPSGHITRISESILDKFLMRKSKCHKHSRSKYHNIVELLTDSDNENNREIFVRTINLCPGKKGRYGFKIKGKSSKNGNKTIIVHDVNPDSPAATHCPRLYEGDQIVSVNGQSIEKLSDSDIETMIKHIQQQEPPNLVLKVYSKIYDDADSSPVDSDFMIPCSSSINNCLSTNLNSSIRQIKRGLETREIVSQFEQLPRRKEDESFEESKLAENIDKNRYRDILPYDSTRVILSDSMTGDYINASYVLMKVPSGLINRYIATQGPLTTTCDDFWQMIWEQNSSLVIMVTPLIEAGKIKCHKYWPNEKEHCRHGQIVIRNLKEKTRAATIERTLQISHIKSDEKRITTQIQYCAWPDHEVPEECSDFLRLINRVRKHRRTRPAEPIVVHCSAGIGRTGVLILMETAICFMESNEPVCPLQILQDMRSQRAMLIQTSSQFQFVTDAICQVYDQKLFKAKKQ